LPAATAPILSRIIALQIFPVRIVFHRRKNSGQSKISTQRSRMPMLTHVTSDEDNCVTSEIQMIASSLREIWLCRHSRAQHN